MWRSIALLLLGASLSAFGASSDDPAKVHLAGTVQSSAHVAETVNIGLVVTSEVQKYLRQHPQASLKTKTDRSGRYQLILPLELETVRIVARWPGYPDVYSVPIRLGAATVELKPLKLVIAAKRKGQVVARHNNEPLPHARIEVTCKDNVRTTLGQQNIRAVYSDSVGRFELTRLSVGTYGIAVSHPTSVTKYEQTLRLDAREALQDIAIKLEVTPKETSSAVRRSMFGRVLDRQTALPIPSVQLEYSGGRTSRSDRNGEFVLSDLSGAPQIELTARAEGYAPRTITVNSGTRPVVIELIPAFELKGRVVRDDDMLPIRARVRLFNSAKVSSATIETDAKGFFKFAPIGSGQYTLKAESPEGISEIRNLSIEPGQSLEEILLKVRVSGRKLVGTIFGLLPDEREFVSLEVRGENTLVFENAVDRNGQYSISGIPPKAATATVRTFLGRSLTKDVPTASAQLDFNLPDQAQVSGSVFRGTEPVSGARVVAKPTDRSYVSAYGFTDAAGKYLIRGLSEGEYSLEASQQSVVIWLAGDSSHDFQLPSLVIRGSVRELRDNEPVAGVSLVVESSGAAALPSGNATSNGQGSYAVDGLDHGNYQISAYKEGFDVARAQVQTSSTPTEVNIHLRRTSGPRIKVTDAKTKLPLRQVIAFVHTQEGIRTQVPLTLDTAGIAQLPGLIEGTNLEVAASGYFRGQALAQGSLIQIALRPDSRCSDRSSTVCAP